MTSPPIHHPPAAKPEALPLLPMQEWKWRSHLAADRAGVDVLQVVVNFREDLDAARFRAAWEVVVAQSSILRTRFVWDHGIEPSQVAEAQAAVPWSVLDWSGLAPEALESRWSSFLQEDRQRGFNLRAAPLLRLCWATVGRGESRLLWTFHHILLDGRSIPMVMEDVFAAYRALGERRTAATPARLGFDRFVHWHQAWWRTHAAEAEVFWRAYLKGLREPTALMVDTTAVSRSAVSELDEIGFSLAHEDTEHLKQTAEALGVTVNTFVQAAWGLLLRRYSGQDEVIFGTVGAGRGGTIPEAAEMLGLFITSLPIRFDFPGSASVAVVLRGLRARYLAVREFEHTPFNQRARWSELPAGTPLIGSVIVFDRDSIVERIARRCGGAGRTFQLLQQPDQALLLSVTSGDQISGELVFDRGRFPRPVMQRMAGQFAHLLRELPRRLEQPLEEVDILPPEQKAELLGFGSGPHAARHGGRLLQSWFEERAETRPDAIAVQTPEAVTTYGQLEARANQLAHQLQHLGAGPDRLIAVALPRGAALVTAVLGVLKSGAAYVPLDPALPPERLALMLEAARPAAVVTGQGVGLPRSEAAGGWVDLEGDRAAIDAWPVLRPESQAAPGHLAYAIFTSGTTGTPKLVGVEHRNIANLLAFATTELFVPEDLACVPFTSSVAGDACVQQIFAALALGGKLVPFPDLMALGASPFFPRFTWLGSTPALLQLFCDTFGLPPAVRLVGVGAEVTPPSLLARLRAHPSIREVYNFFGPTEATVYCTVARFLERSAAPPQEEDAAAKNRVRLIGRPVANARCHVLDNQGRTVPLGVAGELVVAGAGVARGYLNDPELTRARFIAEPGNPNGRAYRTGDSVRWHPDGQLEFLGRRDTQVKVNGARVELEEIESHLLAFPQVTQAAVTATTSPDGRNRLAAFVVMPAPEFDAAKIRRFLRGPLPHSLVPPTVVRLESMPLTATGKIDRRRLPQPPAASQSPRATAENDTERRLVAIWAEVLRRPETGAEDDFFSSGGDSLQAAVLLMSIEAELGVKVTAADLVERPTPRELALWLSDGPLARTLPAVLLSEGNEGRFVRVQRGGASPPILVFLGGYGVSERAWNYEPLFAELPDHPVHCYVAPKLNHLETPAHNLRFLLQDSLRAMKAADVDPGGEVIIWTRCIGAAFGLELARQIDRGGRTPVAMLDPAMPTGRLTARARAMAFTRLGVQLRYHRNALRSGDWPARVAYAKGVVDRAIRRASMRFGRETADEPRASRRVDANRHFQDLVTYPRALLSHRTRPHPGPMLVMANQEETRPGLERAWRRLAGGDFHFSQVPGDHFSVVTQHAAEVGARLRRWIHDIGP